MKIIKVTRFYSGFRNIADRYQAGDADSANTSVGEYILPHGYMAGSGSHGDWIVDAAGYEVGIFAQHGRLELVSLAGPTPNAVLAKAP